MNIPLSGLRPAPRGLDPMLMSRNFDVLAAILGAIGNIPLTYPEQRQTARSRALPPSLATVACGWPRMRELEIAAPILAR
jgi:hypothetical protein